MLSCDWQRIRLCDLMGRYLPSIKRHFIGAATTICSQILAYGYGINVGKMCRFNGIPLFRRTKGSSIIISDGCTFNSRSEFNFIGINRPCILATLSDNAAIQIGTGCGFSGTSITAGIAIRLGDRVRCGANTTITDTDWHTDDPRTTPPEPIFIEDDVWLGANVTVLKGVTIGSGSVIGMGSIVTKSIPSSVVAAGSPARVLRKIILDRQAIRR